MVKLKFVLLSIFILNTVITPIRAMNTEEDKLGSLLPILSKKLTLSDKEIKENIDNYKRAQTEGNNDFISHLRQDNPLKYLPMLNIKTIESSIGPLTYINSFNSYHNIVHLFNQNHESCTSMTFSWQKLLLDIDWTYTEKGGYEKKAIETIIHTTISHIQTDGTYRNKGLATLVVKEFVKFVFNETSTDFIVTSVSIDRPYSKRVFDKNNFKETKIIDDPNASGYNDIIKSVYGDISKKEPYNEQRLSFISLDGSTWIRPCFYLGCGGNLYLSRKDFLNEGK